MSLGLKEKVSCRKWNMGQDLWAQARDWILVLYSIHLQVPNVWRPQSYLILTALSLYFLTSSLTCYMWVFTCKWYPFSSSSFMKTSSSPFSTTVWINNLPVFKPNLHIVSSLFLLFKRSIQTADEESLPKGKWPEFFLSEQQSWFAKGTKKWVGFFLLLFFCLSG